MTVLVDTSVVMYAAGRPHRHRESCQAVLARIAAGSLDATTSVEVVQEILHRFSHGDRELGARMAQAVIELFGSLLPVDHALVADTVDRFRRYAQLSARDAIHAATCVVHGLEGIVSIDTDFDGLPDVVRIEPADLAG